MPPFKPRLAIRQIRIIGAESTFLILLIGTYQGYRLMELRRFDSFSNFIETLIREEIERRQALAGQVLVPHHHGAAARA